MAVQSNNEEAPFIRIRGANVNNLKNLSSWIFPRDKFCGILQD